MLIAIFHRSKSSSTAYSNTAHIVVVREDHDVIHIPVHVIIGEAFVHLGHTASPARLPFQAFRYSSLKREVHHAWQIALCNRRILAASPANS